MEGSLSHLSVLFLRSRGRAIVRVAAGALTDSSMNHDLVVDVVDERVHDHRCASRPQGVVVDGCCRLPCVVVVAACGGLGLCLDRTHRIEALRLDAPPTALRRIVARVAAKRIAGQRV